MSVTRPCTAVARLDSAVAAAPIVAAVGSSVAAETAVLTASYALSTASMPDANSDFASDFTWSKSPLRVVRPLCSSESAPEDVTSMSLRLS
jgi:hypothetical protein